MLGFDTSQFDMVAENDPNIEQLSITFSKIGNKGIHSLCNAMKKNTHIQSIRLLWNKIEGEAGGKSIANMITNLHNSNSGISNNDGLKELSLCFNPLGDEGCIPISISLQTNKTIIALALEKCEIGNDGGVAIGHMLRYNQTLKSLILNENHIGMKGVKAISNGLLHNHSLEVLDLRCNEIGSESTIQLSRSLQHNKTLKELILTKNRIMDVGAAALGTNTFPCNTPLLRLDLEDNNIGNSGCFALCNGLISGHSKSSLQILNLSNNKISDDGFTCIGNTLLSSSLCSLLILDLSRNNGSKDGLLSLVGGMQNNMTITKLDIHLNNGMDLTGHTEKGHKDLRDIRLIAKLQKELKFLTYLNCCGRGKLLQNQPSAGATFADEEGSICDSRGARSAHNSGAFSHRLPHSMWPLVFAKMNGQQYQADAMYYFLKEGPDLFA